MTQEELQERFLYVDEKLVYRESGYKRAKGAAIRTWVGNKQGHHYCAYGGKSVCVHRVVWILHNGSIPEGVVIDHINRVPSDNRIENLRLATKSQNKLNTTITAKRYKTTTYKDASGKTQRRYEKVITKSTYVLGRI